MPDWADRRAREFVESMVAKGRLEVGHSRELIRELAENFRNLADACEPRSPLDM